MIDTGPIVAAMTPSDTEHQRCLDALGSLKSAPLLTPLYMQEVCYFVGGRGSTSGESSFVRSVARGTFRLVDLTPADLGRIADLIDQYSDFPLGSADASVVAVAERLGEVEIMTLDRRHFAALRLRHASHFELRP